MLEGNECDGKTKKEKGMGSAGEIELLNKVIRIGITKKVTFETPVVCSPWEPLRSLWTQNQGRVPFGSS